MNNQDLSNKINSKSYTAGTMKSLLKGLTFFMIVFCLLAGTGKVTTSAASVGYLDVSSSWTLYKTSSLKTKICTVPKDAEVTLLKLNEKYAKIQFVMNGKKKTGYVKSKAFAFATEPAFFQLRDNFYFYKHNYVNGEGKLDARGEAKTFLGYGKKVYVFGFQSVGNNGYARVAYEDGGNLRFGWCDKEAYEKKILKEQYKIIKTGYYRILSRGDDGKKTKSLDVSGLGSNEKTNVTIYDFYRGINQKFKIVHVKEGWHKIIVPYANKCLQMDGNNINIGKYNGGDKQLWRFIDAGNGYVYVKSKANVSNNIWDVAGAKNSNGANLQTYSFHGNWNQQWAIAKW